MRSSRRSSKKSARRSTLGAIAFGGFAITTVAFAWLGCGSDTSGNGGGLLLSTNDGSAEANGASGACGGAQASCNGVCATLESDTFNCGRCGHACRSGEACISRACVPDCGAAQVGCVTDGGIGYCASTQTDNANCGACGRACKVGEVCSSASCTSSGTCAGTGETACVSDKVAFCALTQTDNANCGACGHVCTLGQTCRNGSCATPLPTCAASQATCYDGEDASVAYCANTQTDNGNCGRCGNVCGAESICVSGACTSACSDAGGLRACTNGAGVTYCANTQTDPNNCGGCGVACANGAGCVNGVCDGVACGASDGGSAQVLCSLDGGPAYCANTKVDNANCGACGTTCRSPGICSAGTCVVSCQTILLLTTGAPASGLVAGLQSAAPSLCTIDSANVNTALPPLATLERYDAVLTYTELSTPYTDPAAVGNAVASYFETGGRVVVALFADGGYALTGNWTAKHYNLFVAATATSGVDSFSSSNPALDLSPQSSILTNVHTLGGAGYRGPLLVTNGGGAIADWAGGTVLAATGVITDASSRHRNRVDLNIHPVEVGAGQWGSDGFRLLANALLYQ